MSLVWAIDLARTWAWTLVAGATAPATQPTLRTISIGGWVTLVLSWLVLGGGLLVCIWIAAHHRVVGQGTTDTEIRSSHTTDPGDPSG